MFPFGFVFILKKQEVKKIDIHNFIFHSTNKQPEI